MGDAIVVISFKIKNLGNPIKGHALKGKVPPNGMQDNEHRHSKQAGIGKCMHAIRPYNASYNAPHGQIFGQPNISTVGRDTQSDHKNEVGEK